MTGSRLFAQPMCLQLEEGTSDQAHDDRMIWAGRCERVVGLADPR